MTDLCRSKSGVKSVYGYFLCIILILFAGFRDGRYVADYNVYEWLYENELYVLEPTFSAISYIVHNVLGDNVVCFFLIYAMLGVGIKILAINRLSTLIPFSILLYVADFFPLHEMTQIRAGVATSIMLLAIIPLFERKMKQFFALVLLATLFHISALILFPLWFLNPHRINKKKWIVFILCCEVIALLKIDVISLIAYIPIEQVREKFELYQLQQEEGNFTANIFSVLFLMKLFLTLVLLWKSEIVVAKNKYGYLLLKIMFLSLASLLVFSQNLAASLRISEFYGVVSIILFPMLYYIIRPPAFAWFVIVTAALGFVMVRIFSMQLISSIPL